MQYKFGFIGTGNMGGALARAISEKTEPEEMLLSNRTAAKARALAEELGCEAGTNAEVASSCRYIFLGVKPQGMAALAEEIAPVLGAREDRFILVTMAAGLSSDTVSSLFGGNIPVIRIMPNTPVAIGEGMILYTANSLVAEAELSEFKEALEYAGICDMISEEKIDAASVISGCGPAFMFMFINAFEEAGKELGLDAEKARLYAEQTMLGAAGLALSSAEAPEELKIKVCSPGGTTIEGVRSFERNGLDKLVREAVQASYKRTLELAGK
ncbi:MAG: pyrroline-5-carboxylate reductase [Eubacteriales bacterium]